MRNRLLFAIAALGLMLPAGVNAQAVMRGVLNGVAVGNRAAGPIGAGVGAVVGGASYAFRSGASKVLGIPEETGSVNRHHSPRKKKIAHH